MSYVHRQPKSTIVLLSHCDNMVMFATLYVHHIRLCLSHCDSMVMFVTVKRLGYVCYIVRTVYLHHIMTSGYLHHIATTGLCS
jgi:hypothetical protein